MATRDTAQFDSKEYWEAAAEDLSRALAAMLRHYGLTHGQFENWEVYLASGGGADAIEVDENGKRTHSPAWIDAFEYALNNPADSPKDSAGWDDDEGGE